MSGSLYLGAQHFDGDPGELLPAYHRLLERFGIDTLDVHLCIVRDDGLTVFDACPGKAVYEEFTTSDAFRDAVAQRELPQRAASRASATSRSPISARRSGRDRRTRAARRHRPGRAGPHRPGHRGRAGDGGHRADRGAEPGAERRRHAALRPGGRGGTHWLRGSRRPGGAVPGVPYLLKDLAIEMEGVRFTEGSRFLADNVSAFDSELVLRLRQAGLVILGKTSTPEFGIPACEPVLFGPVRNPWDTRRSTSGSSGGPAAAVASGMVPFAHGNDLGGSLRYPASACGLFALKPTRARNPLGPEYGDVAAGGAAEHALTRSVRDSAALLDATSGPDLGDPYWAPPPDVRSWPRWAPTPDGCGSATPPGRPTATPATPTALRPPITPPVCAPRSATR